MNNVEHHSHRPVNTKSKKRRLENKTEDEETVIQKQPSPKPNFAGQSCTSNLTDGGVNLKVRGLTGTWGAVGIEMPKFKAKKGDFAKIWQKLGGYSSTIHESMYSKNIRVSNQSCKVKNNKVLILIPLRIIT